ncbi:MS4A6A isoform 9 [Pan troglodytes]|uniref:Membrane spanning 4-domains A6A n=3 Tax=Pan TaxID=9596 RepID=A0A2I3SUX0_PANTR|nr:MS4A6A isoform 9 [Pan troglodytes]
MTSQPVPNETIIVLPSNVINFSQAEKSEPTNQGQDSLKKHLHTEIKVIGVHSSLVGSILSALSALVGFIILSVKLATLNPASLQWNSLSDVDLHSAGILPSCAHCCAAVETGLL